MDAIQFLKQEHQKAEAAFANVLKATPETRGELWTKLQPELEAHEEMEDLWRPTRTGGTCARVCVYEPLSRDAGKKDFELASGRIKHQKEVDKVDGLIKQLGKLDPEKASWLTKVNAVHRSLGKHIQEEEQDIFPPISKVWNEKKPEAREPR